MSDIRARDIHGVWRDVRSDKDDRLFTVEGGSGHIYTVSVANSIAISKKTTVGVDFPGRPWKLKHISVVFSAANTTSQNLTLTQNPGNKFSNRPSTVLFSQDPSTTSATSVINIWEDGGLKMQAGDEVTLAYTHSDANTAKAEIVIEVL